MSSVYRHNVLKYMLNHVVHVLIKNTCLTDTENVETFLRQCHCASTRTYVNNVRSLILRLELSQCRQEVADFTTRTSVNNVRLEIFMTQA